MRNEIYNVRLGRFQKSRIKAKKTQKTAAEQLYVYRWGTNGKQRAMKGRVCRVQRRMKLNNCIIEFIDNHQLEVVSRNALRKVKHGQKKNRHARMG